MGFLPFSGDKVVEHYMDVTYFSRYIFGDFGINDRFFTSILDFEKLELL